MNLEKYIDIVGGKIDQLDLKKEVLNQIRYRDPSEILIKINPKTDYCTIYIPKKDFKRRFK